MVNFQKSMIFYSTTSGWTRSKILPINSRFSRFFFQFYPHIQGFQGYFLHFDQIQGFSRFSRLSGHPGKTGMDKMGIFQKKNTWKIFVTLISPN